MLITSKFPGVCLVCSRAIVVGDRVSWVRGVKGAAHAMCSAEGKAMAEKIAPSSATDSDMVLPCPDGLAYLGYQKAGIAYALNPERTGVLIADEMGLGKTIQAIGVINASPAVRRVLIICPASLKTNWRNELRTWLTRPATIVVHPLATKDKNKSERDLPATDANRQGGSWTNPNPPVDVTIINYDILKKLEASAALRAAERVGNEWDLMILDEVHYVKNPKTARAKLVNALRKRATRVLALTGTPIENRPYELWPILQLVAPEFWDPAGLKGQAYVGVGEGAGFFRFAKRYCDAKKEWYGRVSHWDFSGASNLPELQEMLRASCMVRRLKADVLTELPAKRRQVIALNRNGSAADVEAEWAALGDREAALEMFGDDIEKMKKHIAFEEISAARKALAISKVDAVLEHVTDCFESSDKIILFAHHHEVIDRLMFELRDFNPAVITGRTPAADRQAQVEKFQEDPTCRLFIGSIGAAGVGITLTASSHVIFAEIDWTPSKMSQAEDRAHRIGQLESVLVQVLVVEGSLDARMIELVQHKQMIADLGLDTETLVDVTEDRAVVETREAKRARELRELAITWEQVQRVHEQLRFLAGLCDGASARDGCGFNKLDTGIGKSLASRNELSPRQALLGQKIVAKYKRQLHTEGFE